MSMGLDPIDLARAKELAAQAWDATKAPDDPPFEQCAGSFRERLLAEAADVMQGFGASTKFGLALKTLLAPVPVKMADGSEMLLTPEHLAELNKIMTPPAEGAAETITDSEPADAAPTLPTLKPKKGRGN